MLKPYCFWMTLQQKNKHESQLMTILFPQDHFLAGRSATSAEPTQTSWSPPLQSLFSAYHSMSAGWRRLEDLVPSPPTTTAHSSSLSLLSEKNAAFRPAHSACSPWGKNPQQSQLASGGQSGGSAGWAATCHPGQCSSPHQKPLWLWTERTGFLGQNQFWVPGNLY